MPITPSPAEEGGRLKLCWCGHAESSHVAPSLGALVGGVWGCMECYDAEPNGLEHIFSPAPAEEGAVPTCEYCGASDVELILYANGRRACDDPFECLRRSHSAAVADVARELNARDASPVSSGTDESAPSAFEQQIREIEAWHDDFAPNDADEAMVSRYAAFLLAALRTAQARVEALERDLADALPSGAEFLDLPDGGDVPLTEQVRRVVAALTETRAALAVSQDREREALVARCSAIDSNPPESPGEVRITFNVPFDAWRQSGAWHMLGALARLLPATRPSSLEGSSDAG